MLGFSSEEGWELLKSTFIVALVFTIAERPKPDPLLVAIVFVITLVAAGTGFIFHEFMHRFLARRTGYVAHYRGGGFPYMSILFAFAGWILLSPGAVVIQSIGKPITRRASGLISLAGPATNFLLALAFAPLMLVGGLVGVVGAYGYDVNIWLAVFNMLPAPGFDGEKVWGWSKPVYFGFAAALVSVYLLFRFVLL